MANVGDFLQVFCEFGLGFASYVISIQRYGRVSFVQNYYNYEWGFGNMLEVTVGSVYGTSRL